MLPIYHGALFADRRVRVLSEVPGVVQGLTPPVAIVDRTAEQATLLGRNGDGRRVLATVAMKDLDGIPVQAVMSLDDFVGRLTPRRRQILGVGGHGIRVADAGTTVGGPIVADDSSSGFAKGFYASLAGYFGMVLESIGSLGGGPGTAGELWAVDLDASGRSSAPRRVGGLARPLLAGDWCRRGLLRRSPGRAGGAARRQRRGCHSARRRRRLAETPAASRRKDRSWGWCARTAETLPARLAADGTLEVGAAPATDEEKRALARLSRTRGPMAGTRPWWSIAPSAAGGASMSFFAPRRNRQTSATAATTTAGRLRCRRTGDVRRSSGCLAGRGRARR